ncbi:diguanylate phosphodiesterase [Clostridia bacterium]|nr:diguanylate phosphodiesterase [Clostridia bacterium]
MKRTTVIALTLAMLLMLAAPSYAEPRTVLNIGITETYTTTDPYHISRTVDNNLMFNLYETLYRIDVFLNEEPLLATSYEASEDGLTYTYHLKQDVQFQTGGELKASDVVYSFTYAAQSLYTMQYTEALDYVEAADDYTVVFHLKNISPTFHQYISQIPIVSESAHQGLPEMYTNEISGGTGPYMLTEWDPEVRVVIERFDGYHGDTPQIQKVVATTIADDMALQMAFEAGEIDYNGISAADRARIESDPRYQTKFLDAPSVVFVIFNTEREPLNNPLVRQALSYATNKEDALYAALDGAGNVMHTICVPSMTWGVPTADEMFTYDFNIEKAKELLAEAGYPNGITFDEPLLFLPGDTYSIAAQVMQDNWAEAGIHVQLRAADEATYVQDLMSGNYLMGNISVTLLGDASNYARLLTTGADLNLARYSNARVDELFAAGNATLDEDVRKAAYQEAFDLISKDAPYLPVFNQSFEYGATLDLEFDPVLNIKDWYFK